MIYSNNKHIFKNEHKTKTLCTIKAVHTILQFRKGFWERYRDGKHLVVLLKKPIRNHTWKGAKLWLYN